MAEREETFQSRKVTGSYSYTSKKEQRFYSSSGDHHESTEQHHESGIIDADRLRRMGAQAVLPPLPALFNVPVTPGDTSDTGAEQIPTDSSSEADESIVPDTDLTEYFVAIADFTPDDEECISLSEGQIVDILDDSNSKKYFVRTRQSATKSSKKGWVPSNIIERQLVSVCGKETRELPVYIVKENEGKENQALIKRQALLDELLANEKQYVAKLKELMRNLLNTWNELQVVVIPYRNQIRKFF